MLLIHTALHIEAKIFIDEYKLKKNIYNNEFDTYANKDIFLIISGVGKVNAASAITYAFLKQEINHVLNFGFCASEKQIGDIYLVNQILDNKEYFPDILDKHPFREENLETVEFPAREKNKGILVDMEGSAVFQIANKFLSPDKIKLIKIVSDNFTPDFFKKGSAKELIAKNKISLFSFINDLINIDKPMDEYEKEVSNLNLSKSQKDILKNSLKYARLRNKKINLDIPLGENKKNNNKIFKQLINKLNE